ncbi:hypothetical protein [Vibrio comitans]|uniref:Uncharacterized protein n=1 Tax=Vibrio comitans NBRC 102076 TaxID=1219078 RepID=A0A4Y3IQP7_9VIBR|nr:hypothetical protein [Vibrio comitans]GEA61507.1 hypothetical protein VCO01S_27000 [Vibrio comitans NBRC 102076]
MNRSTRNRYLINILAIIGLLLFSALPTVSANIDKTSYPILDKDISLALGLSTSYE